MPMRTRLRRPCWRGFPSSISGRKYCCRHRAWSDRSAFRSAPLGRHCQRCLADATRLTRSGAALRVGSMSEDAPDSLIPYDEIVQEALRAVVGRVLGEVESTG